jgi:phage gpG-like protein
MQTGVRIEIDARDLAKVEALVTKLSHVEEHKLVTEIVQLGENQTRKRIEAGGPAPDGAPWKPNRAGTPILRQTGRHLRDSIASASQGSTGEWGAAWEFAHVHQEGATIVPRDAVNLAASLGGGGVLSFEIGGGQRVFAKRVTIPARPFVGVSRENGKEIEAQVTDFLGRLLQ